MAKVFIIDRDPEMQGGFRQSLEQAGHSVVWASDRSTLDQARLAHRCDVAFVGSEFGDASSLDILNALRCQPSPPEVLMLSSTADPDLAEAALRAGAWDFVVKPCSTERLLRLLDRAVSSRLQSGDDRVIQPMQSALVGSDPRLMYCLRQAALAAQSMNEVLVMGETGTGKDLVARAVHNASKRKNGPFVIVDCAALPGNLAESLLFGHVRGAFTGAESSQQGLVAQANGGTLFLDEVGELPIAVQSKFLRVLQTRRYRPVGAQREEKSDFRLIAATNRDLEKMTREGGFRSDLLFRLKTVHVDLPPLRERKGDISALAVHLLSRHARESSQQLKGASPEFLQALSSYGWPGNVRELKHALEAACLAAGDAPTLLPHHLPFELRVCYTRDVVGRPELCQKCFGENQKFEPVTWAEYRKRAVKTAEAEYVLGVLEHTGQNVKKAISLSGLKTARFYELMKSVKKRKKKEKF
ncbi:sigma-54-dependent transcriptional regulator [Desulfobaculum bizertense]|uniref:Two-component system, NtrC family, response regulator n=1 Tax=Desulfobaculum bizertense DSM 18034 TaxID=1121442 RepID=A0A1T4VX06_9BACT|nr:sigma-54 dependent transcriptional regulator [Desulfobaculum bizertense]SKA69467.1 two-component system, NtrC family, response regulator [Desulfobaculum bizertense DSM 18034]